MESSVDSANEWMTTGRSLFTRTVLMVLHVQFKTYYLIKGKYSCLQFHCMFGTPCEFGKGNSERESLQDSGNFELTTWSAVL